MYQVIEMSHREKMKMYMKCTKKKLAEMLIECNRILDAQLVKNIDNHLYEDYIKSGKLKKLLRNKNKQLKQNKMKNFEELRKATPSELMLRLKRASLVVLLTEIKKLEAQYKKATGKDAPPLRELLDEHYPVEA